MTDMAGEFLNICLIQPRTVWESPADNIRYAESVLNTIEGPVDLVGLPETFATGFSMAAAAEAESMNGPSVEFMKCAALKLQAVVCGSLFIREGGNIFNRLIWAGPGEDVGFYDKAHLFPLEGEDRIITPGADKKIFSAGNWKIAAFVCYDLRFPCWMRNAGAEYDAAFVCANWPASRREHWIALLRARAIENQCYVIAVNRTGADGRGLLYSGDSCVIGPDGEYLLNMGRKEGAGFAAVSYSALREYREKFPFLKIADR